MPSVRSVFRPGTLMTGTPPRTHGDRVFKETLPMPDHLPTLAQTFRNAGYQAYAVGKLHVYPQRNRIGFDDVILDEEGRQQYGAVDDYELFLGDEGYAGQYRTRHEQQRVQQPALASARAHPPTNWATTQMCRVINGATRPGPAGISPYRHPHPPIVPLPLFGSVP
ncbi:MAG: sulfatase-like hydrolase/transferase [Caldilineaceae bacterium]